jgi:hypothetical protein
MRYDRQSDKNKSNDVTVPVQIDGEELKSKSRTFQRIVEAERRFEIFGSDRIHESRSSVGDLEKRCLFISTF